MRIFLLLIILTKFYLVYSQPMKNKSANQWYFPRFNGLDFNSDTVQFLLGCNFSSTEASSTICDLDGRIMFYTDGNKIWNKYNKVVRNGDEIGFPYLGQYENTSCQGAILLKHPENDSLLYLFCSDYQGRSGGLVYSVISIHDNNDSGEVIAKKIKLSNTINEPLTAVNHQNGRDIWITCHGFKNDTFNSFLLTKKGIIKCPVITKIGAVHIGQFGSGGSAQVGMKYSYNGHYIVSEQNWEYKNEIFRFSTENGKFFDTVYSKNVDLCPFTAFSPDHKLLYLFYYDTGLVQMDILSGKRTFLYNFNLTSSQYPGDIQMGPDNKIYGIISKTNDLFIINNPNVVGSGCDLIIKKNFLKSGVGDRALPNFNQSTFYTTSVDFKYEISCTKNSISLSGFDTIMATNYSWKIYAPGKALEASYSTKNANHTFKKIGVYKVIFIADNGFISDTIEKSIEIYPLINKDFLGEDTTYFQGALINRILKTPSGMHCITWHDGSGSETFQADTTGVFFCTVVRQDFCQVTDTIIISECIKNLTEPSIYRNRDTMYTYQQLADSFVWFRNEQLYRITKENFLKLTDTGHYRVEAAKKGHCNRSSKINWVNKLGLQTISLSDLNIQLYPNPSTGIVNIVCDNKFELLVTDLTGRTIHSAINIDQINLQGGVYFFNFLVNDSHVTAKVIIY